MGSVGGRRAVHKAAASGASRSLAAAGVRPALAHQNDRDRHRSPARDLALDEWQMRTTKKQRTVVPSVLITNRVTWREP